MSKSYLILSALMAGVLCIHLFAGGPEYADAFRAELSDPKLASMAIVLWHAVTVILGGLALAYLWLAYAANRALAVFTGAVQVGWAILFLALGIIWLGEIVTMPQWVLFLGFPAATLFIEARRA